MNLSVEKSVNANARELQKLYVGLSHSQARSLFKRSFKALGEHAAANCRDRKLRLTCDRHPQGRYVPVQPLWNQLAAKAAGG